MRHARNARLLRRNESHSANAAAAAELGITIALPLANQSPGVSQAQIAQVAVSATNTARTPKPKFAAFDWLVRISIDSFR